ncbi:MAG: dTDP-4-dehydrorhamnose reductase [Pseudohongiellaceae bacterium]|jgi:dTDP-4-dehydrorhamnose reductase
MRVLVTGAEGMLGHAFASSCPADVELIATDVAELDITDTSMVAAKVAEVRPDALVNLAAYTAVDDCESHESLALSINGAGPGFLAGACSKAGIPLLHVSTDYVFDGGLAEGAEYSEADATGPLSAYGRTKLAGELAVAAATSDYWIVRTQWLYGIGGPNFVETMLRLAGERDTLTVVNDQWGSPTSTHTLAPVLWAMLQQRPAFGIYHGVNRGSCSWFDFAREIFAQSKLSITVDPMDSTALQRPAPRPARSILGTGKLRSALNQDITPWAEALADYLQRRKTVSDSTP